MLPGIPGSATCVQKFDDSLNSAIHITYRISLRSSSLREPRYPLLRVLDRFDFARLTSRTVLILLNRATHDPNVLTQSCTNKRVWLLMRLLHHSCGSCRSKANTNTQETSTFRKGWYGFTIMILPQVHLRKPCYDFTFL